MGTQQIIDTLNQLIKERDRLQEENNGYRKALKRIKSEAERDIRLDSCTSSHFLIEVIDEEIDIAQQSN